MQFVQFCSLDAIKLIQIKEVVLSCYISSKLDGRLFYWIPMVGGVVLAGKLYFHLEISRKTFVTAIVMVFEKLQSYCS